MSPWSCAGGYFSELQRGHGTGDGHVRIGLCGGRQLRVADTINSASHHPCICHGSAPIVGAQALFTFRAVLIRRPINSITAWNRSLEPIWAAQPMPTRRACVHICLFCNRRQSAVTKNTHFDRCRYRRIESADRPAGHARFRIVQHARFFIGSGNPTIANSSAIPCRRYSFANHGPVDGTTRTAAIPMERICTMPAGSGRGGVTVIDKYAFSKAALHLGRTLSAGKTRFDGGAQTISFGYLSRRGNRERRGEAGTSTIDKLTFATEGAQRARRSARMQPVPGWPPVRVRSDGGAERRCGSRDRDRDQQYNWTTEAIARRRRQWRRSGGGKSGV